MGSDTTWMGPFLGVIRGMLMRRTSFNDGHLTKPTLENAYPMGTPYAELLREGPDGFVGEMALRHKR